ncbi:DUF6126 family protein [Streptomyces bikiniensis]|uniref:DUF6126 family protein n=1 Tax=Streptomyces bikiniensis TaxID=1896 RepID=A0ABW8CPC5_STRBI
MNLKSTRPTARVPSLFRALAPPSGTHALEGTTDPGTDTERWKERGVMLRVFVYVFATHAFAGFVRILFSVGQNARK